eukprot:PhM_4_TR14214/c0_g1_i1/m.15161
MGILGDVLQINLGVQLHLLCVDAENLKPTDFVRNTDIQLSIEATETTQSWINRVGAVRRGDYDDLGTGLETVHEGQELGHNALLYFSVGLLTLRGDRVNLIDKDDGRGVLLCFFESFAKVAFGLTCHFGHNFRAVDEEEERTSLVGNGAGNERLSGAGRAVHQNTARGLDTNGLEELRVTDRELNHLTNLSELLAAATDVVVANFVELLLVLALDGVAFTVDHCVGGNDAVRRGVHFDDFELNGTHASTHQERIALADWTVVVDEVGLQECFKEITCQTFDGVVNGKHVNSAPVLDVLARVDKHNVAEVNTQVTTNDLVHTDLARLKPIIRLRLQ